MRFGHSGWVLGVMTAQTLRSWTLTAQLLSNLNSHPFAEVQLPFNGKQVTAFSWLFQTKHHHHKITFPKYNTALLSCPPADLLVGNSLDQTIHSAPHKTENISSIIRASSVSTFFQDMSPCLTAVNESLHALDCGFYLIIVHKKQVNECLQHARSSSGSLWKPPPWEYSKPG